MADNPVNMMDLLDWYLALVIVLRGFGEGDERFSLARLDQI